MRRRLIPFLLLLIGLLVAGGCGDKERLDPSKHGGVIIYSSSYRAKPVDNIDLYATYADGSATRRLTDTSKECESTPILMTDQKSFFFYRFTCPASVQEAPTLWRMNLDGTGEHRVDGIERGEWPYPSPDGRDIVVLGYQMTLLRDGKRSTINIPAGTRDRRDWPLDMAWSLNGKFFAFPLEGEGITGTALFVLDPSTNEVTRASRPQDEDLVDLSPAISNDGRYLAFTRVEDVGVGELHYGSSPAYIADLNSGNEKLLPGEEGYPKTFTPDGSELIYKDEDGSLLSYSLPSGKKGSLGWVSWARTARSGALPERQSPVALAPDQRHWLIASRATGKGSADAMELSTINDCGLDRHEIGRVKQDPGGGGDLMLAVIGPYAAWAEIGAKPSADGLGKGCPPER